jgi:hypothetical protein
MKKQTKILIMCSTIACVLISLIVLSVLYINNTTYENGLYEVKYDRDLSQSYFEILNHLKTRKIHDDLKIVKYNGKTYLCYDYTTVSGNYGYGIDAIERIDDTLYVYKREYINLEPSGQVVRGHNDFYEVPFDMLKGTYKVEFISLTRVSGKPFEIVSTNTNRKLIASDDEVYKNIHQTMINMNTENTYIKYFAIYLKPGYGDAYVDCLDSVVEKYSRGEEYQLTTTISVDDTEWIVYYTVVPMENH